MTYLLLYSTKLSSLSESSEFSSLSKSDGIRLMTSLRNNQAITYLDNKPDTRQEFHHRNNCHRRRMKL